MNRSDRLKKRRLSLYIAITIFALILFLGTWNQIAKNKNTFVPAGGTSNDDQMITIELPDGNVMTTNEKNIYYKDDKMYYKSKYNEIDITGAKIKDETK